MDSNLTRLTVLFEAPFWVGIFERIEGNTLSVCKVTFGAEPKDYEVLAYVLKTTAVCGSVRLLPRPSGRTRQIRSGCSARSGSRPLPAPSAPGHSRRCSCSARRRSLKSRPARASSGKKKSSAALPAGSRNERKSTGANSPGAFFAAAHAFLYSPVISRCFFLGRAWRTRR